MVIIHISGLTNNKYGGPNINVPQTTKYENKVIRSALYDCLGNNLNNIIDKKIIYFSINNYDNISKLPIPFNKPDLVIFESMYIKEFIHIYKEIKKNNIPYIIVPRGSLTKSAQNKKRIKKILGNLLFFNKFVNNAEAIHFLTKNEYQESKCFKFKNYYIVGNGVESPKKYKNTFNTNTGEKFIITFIGRIEMYHKGLDILFEAIKLGQETFRNQNFSFNFYGPNKIKSIEFLRNYAKQNNIIDLISFNDPIDGIEKEKVLLQSDMFIHTSRLEGQPTAVIEAISYGIPVFVTPGTNIDQEVEKNGLGFTCSLDAVEIKNKLFEAFQNRKKFNEISKNSIAYAQKKFDWDNVTKKNIEEYNNILNRIR